MGRVEERHGVLMARKGRWGAGARLSECLGKGTECLGKGTEAFPLMFLGSKLA